MPKAQQNIPAAPVKKTLKPTLKIHPPRINTPQKKVKSQQSPKQHTQPR